MAQVVAILSGKGGTGKTTVCAGVASALAMEGKKVLCIDCDVGLRNLDIALGMSEESALSFVELCRDGFSLDQATKHITYENLSFQTAPAGGYAEEIESTDFLRLLQKAREQFDYIFLDAPAGLDAGFRLAAQYADRVILVTGADPAAVRDAARVGQVLEMKDKTDIRLVVNRVNKKTVSFMGWTVDDIMDNAGLPLLGVVPEDEKVLLAATFKIPLLTFTRKGAAKAMKRIAKRLEGHTVKIAL